MQQKQRERRNVEWRCCFFLLCLSIFRMVGTTCCIIAGFWRSNSQLRPRTTPCPSSICTVVERCAYQGALIRCLGIQTYLRHRLKDSKDALCCATANIDLFSFLSSFFPAIHLFVSACFTFCFPFSFFFFSLLELRYSHQLIFTSLCLFSLLTTAICCLPTPARHISKSLFSSITSSAMFSFNHPLKKYMHL